MLLSMLNKLKTFLYKSFKSLNDIIILFIVIVRLNILASALAY